MDQQVFVGLDVGKTFHHVVVLRADGTTVVDRRVRNEQADLEAVFADVAVHGQAVVCVDQVQSIGALPVAVAQGGGLPVRYLAGRRMRTVAATFAGAAKTDARDAAIIAEAARSMPHTVRAVAPVNGVVADLRLLCGHDDDLVKQATVLKNRLRGLLSQVHPPLERVLGPRLADAGVLALLKRWPLPTALRRAGKARVERYLRTQGSRRAAPMAKEIGAALDRQTVILPGTEMLQIVLPQLADQLQLVCQLRREVARRLPALLDQHPQSAIIRSLPGFGPTLTARTLIELAGKEFASAAHLASYAGLAPVTRQSGTSIRHQTRSTGGNRALRNAWYQAAYASLQHDRRYYDRKRQAGQHHVQALLALARRRVDVLYAMLRDGTCYRAPLLD